MNHCLMVRVRVRVTLLTQAENWVFLDASERAYGAVAYIWSEDQYDQVSIAFVAARSRVAPKKQISVSQLELCAALSGTQLATTVKNEITLPIHKTTFWRDSTTVLQWLH